MCSLFLPENGDVHSILRYQRHGEDLTSDDASVQLDVLPASRSSGHRNGNHPKLSPHLFEGPSHHICHRSDTQHPIICRDGRGQLWTKAQVLFDLVGMVMDEHHCSNLITRTCSKFF